jgi:hypothetical protein
VLDLALLDEVFHGAGNVFDGHVRVDPMLVEEVDRLDAEALARTVDTLFEVVGTAVDDLLAVRVDADPELGGDHNLIADRGEGFPDQLFVPERAVGLGGVEEGDAKIHGLAEQSDHPGPVRSWAVGEAHAHAAEAERRDFETAGPKNSFLHVVLLRLERQDGRWRIDGWMASGSGDEADGYGLASGPTTLPTI